MRKRVAIIGIAAALAGGASIAAAAVNHDTDPPAERQAEARYTAAHEDEAAVTRAQAERAALGATTERRSTPTSRTKAASPGRSRSTTGASSGRSTWTPSPERS